MDAQTLPNADDLLEQIRDMKSLLREEGSAAEDKRRMSDRVAEALRRRGIFRMYRPRERGGLGFDPVSGFRVVEELSRIDSAIGWNVAIANGLECFGAYFSDDVTEKVLGPPDTVLAGGLFPPRKAVAVEGGFRISGKSMFNSNCHAATWFLVEAEIYDAEEPRLDGDGNPEGLFILAPASDAKIVENWDTLGMRGTGSHDVEFRDVYVPETYTAPLRPLESASPAYSSPMHRLTFWPPIAINAVPALGIAQAAIDDFVDLAGVKVSAYTSGTLRERSVVQLRLAKAEGKLRAARALLHATFDELWQYAAAGNFLTIEQKADCQQAAAHTVLASAEAVELIHSVVSSAGIRNGKPFQRHFRDIHVITQHAFMCEARLEAVGQVRLGMEPDWPFLPF